MIVQARNLLEAIQHSTLDRLLRRIFPLLEVAMLLAVFQSDGLTLLTKALLVLAPIVGVLVYWLLGRVARTPIPGETARPLSSQTRNGFEAWHVLPNGGLRPPRPIGRTLGWLEKTSTLRSRLSIGLTLLVIVAAAFVYLAPRGMTIEGLDLLGRQETMNALLVIVASVVIVLINAILTRWQQDTAPYLAPES